MNMFKQAVAILAGLVLAACATPALWKATNPSHCVAVVQSHENEAELKARGLPYHTDEKRGLFYVEQSGLQKSKDYLFRAVGTPVTIVLDAATTVAVVGVIVFVTVHWDSAHYQWSKNHTNPDAKTSLQQAYEAVRKKLRFSDSTNAAPPSAR